MLNVTRLNLAEIKTTVARYMRKQTTGTTGHVAPTDVGDNDWILSSINLGVARVVGAHQWSWLHQPFSVELSADGTGPTCINADLSKYRMPAHIHGVPFGDVYCIHSGRSKVDVREVGYVDRIIAENDATGVPELVSFSPSVVDGGEVGQGMAWVMTVYPKPSSNWTIKGVFRINVPKMVEDLDVGVWPAVMDRLMIAAAVRELLDYGILPPSAAERAESTYAELLTQAIALDEQTGWPRQTGEECELQDWEKVGLIYNDVVVWP